jgi:hypothetical protein
MDFDRAMKNPASIFATPEALSESRELTAEQKRAVLLQWKDQLQQLQAADDEGMRQNYAAESTTDDLLKRVTSTLTRIDADLKRVSNSGWLLRHNSRSRKPQFSLYFRRTGREMTVGSSISGAASLNALSCSGFRNITEQPEQARKQVV